MSIFKPVLKLFWNNVEKGDAKRIASQTPTPGIEQICDIPYIESGERAHLLDIYYPEGTTEKLPVIIDIHGGGWMYGYKEINKYYCLKLAKKGFLVASINYRLADKVQFKDQIEDIFTAFYWLKENLSSYPADTDNIFLVGDSAGGHFACVSTAINLESDLQNDFGLKPTGFDFKAVGAVSPAIDLVSPNLMMNVNVSILLGKNYKKSKFYKYMDYANLVSDKLPPFYIVTSSGDFLRKQAYKLKELLDKNTVENIFEDYTEKVGGKKLEHVFSVINPYTAPAEKVIDIMTDFFKSKITANSK